MKNQDPIRVLHVVGSLERGGTETWLVALLTELSSEKNIESEVLVQVRSSTDSYEAEVTSLGVPVHFLPRSWNWPLRYFKLLRRNRFSVVHSHRNEFSAFVLLIAFFAGVPTRIAHSHSDRTRDESAVHKIYRHCCRWILSLCATIQIGVSEEARRSLFGDADARSNVIYCGLNLDRNGFSPESRVMIRRELGISDQETVLLHVGSFRRVKNHRFLLDVFEQYQKNRSERSWLLLVGDGSLKSEIEALSATMGLEGSVRFLGVRNDIPDLMSAGDVFVFPSLFEGLSIAAIEAQASGLPIVLSDTQSMEVIVDETKAVAVSLNSPSAAWAAIIESILNKPSSRGAAPAGIERFDIRTNADRMMNMYLRHPRQSGKSSS